MKLPRLLETISLLVVANVLSIHAQGFKGLNCPATNSTVVACYKDCRDQHGALYGFCGRGTDYNCYCSQSIRRVPNPSSFQCKDKKNNKNWDKICQYDCTCNHGGTNGRCNYKTNVCECFGRNFNMDLCPFTSLEELIDYYNTTSNLSNPNGNVSGKPLKKNST